MESIQCADEEKYDGKSIFYFLEINDTDSKLPVYKFGITADCRTRLKTHRRKLNIIRVVKLIDCGYDLVMRHVETCFKRYAKSLGVMVVRYKLTEILMTDEIQHYIDWVNNMIEIERAKPHLINLRERNSKQDIDHNKSCNSCGKCFVSEAHLKRHINRTTPCVIREVSEEDRKNPNRCIHCNKIFSKKENLTKHGKTCKVKNRGPNTIYGKNNFDGQIRTLIEEQEQKNKEYDQKIKDLQIVMEQNTQRLARNERLIAELIARGTATIEELRTNLPNFNNESKVDGTDGEY
jgi:hypothetical protein